MWIALTCKVSNEMSSGSKISRKKPLIPLEYPTQGTHRFLSVQGIEGFSGISIGKLICIKKTTFIGQIAAGRTSLLEPSCSATVD